MKRRCKFDGYNIISFIMILIGGILATWSVLELQKGDAFSPTQVQLTSHSSLSTSSYWLEFLDDKHYAKSWEASAMWFKHRTPQDQWIADVQTIRHPLGSIQERILQSTNEAITLPGMPDGDYVTLTYYSRFERKHSALETVTLIKEEPRLWKVVGYSIH